MNAHVIATVCFVGLAQSTTYPSMYCTSDSSYVNSMDGIHNNVKSDRFLNGMDSNHENHYEDRQFKWRYCRPSTDSTPIEKTETLGTTLYDAEWTKSCATLNGGNAAMVGAYSTHHNYYEDRLWTWYCGHLDSSFALANCAWSGIINGWDADVNYDCANNGVIRSIWSQHHNYYEDRKWNFECCRVINSNCNNCAKANGEIASDALDTEPVNGSSSPFWKELSSGAIVAICAGICVAVVAVMFALYVGCRSRKFVGVLTNDDEEEEEEDELDGLDNETALSAEMVSIVEGTETQHEENSPLQA